MEFPKSRKNHILKIFLFFKSNKTKIQINYTHSFSQFNSVYNLHLMQQVFLNTKIIQEEHVKGKKYTIFENKKKNREFSAPTSGSFFLSWTSKFVQLFRNNLTVYFKKLYTYINEKKKTNKLKFFGFREIFLFRHLCVYTIFSLQVLKFCNFFLFLANTPRM